jgi:hypothetical protein
MLHHRTGIIIIPSSFQMVHIPNNILMLHILMGHSLIHKVPMDHNHHSNSSNSNNLTVLYLRVGHHHNCNNSNSLPNRVIRKEMADIHTLSLLHLEVHKVLLIEGSSILDRRIRNSEGNIHIHLHQDDHLHHIIHISEGIPTNTCTHPHRRPLDLHS